MAYRDAVGVLKIGGSVLTDRRKYCTIEGASLRRVAEALAGWLPVARFPVILILGGGSFGHNVVLEHELELDGQHGRPAEAFELTARLFELKSALARELAARRTPVMPLQETALFLRRVDGSLVLTAPAVLTQCFELGWLPVLTGGLVADGEKAFAPVSSDRLAIPLAEAFPVWRYVVLTDRPGLCDPNVAGWPLVERVPRDRHAEALTMLRSSSKVDVTGGMRGKLVTILELAAKGVGSVIGDGRSLDAAALTACFGDRPPGTYVEA